MRYRRAKERHNFVAHELVNRPSVLLDHRNEMFEAVIQKVARTLRINFLGQRGITGNIGKHHCDQFAFTR